MTAAYHELVVEGPRDKALGFAQGFLAARGLAEALLDAEAEGFLCEPLRERLRELFQPGRDVLHLLCPASAVASVRQALAAETARGWDVRIVTDRPLQGARFSFEFRIYSREHGAQVRAFLEAPPAGVRALPGLRLEEIEHPDAKGMEAYAPVHDYELHGSGTLEGQVPGIVELLRRCRDNELVQVSGATLLPTGG